MSANGSPTEKISALVDIFLRPHLTTVKSYLKDTTHFLNILGDLPTLELDTILCTLDVGSLYTNIPNLEGKRAVAKTLIKHRKHIEDGQPTNTSLCQMLDMVLTMNNFRFNEQHYLQMGGTAMGTRVAPTYANFFMGDFEDTHIYTYPLQPLLWVRFIDDIFMVWEHGEKELKSFLTHLNTVHKTIKFTSNNSHHRVNFLDTWVIKQKDGRISTDLYTKPTDSNNYLEFTSAHPAHTKRAIPLSQFLRLRRICTDRKNFTTHCIDKGKHFLRRGYPAPSIKGAFIEALHRERASLLKPKTQKDSKGDQSIIVSTYNPGFKGLRPLVQSNWDILGRSCSTRKIHQTKLTAAYRKPKNLKDILVRARLPSKATDRTSQGEDPPKPCNPCHTKNCRYCPHINKTGRVKCHITGREYMAK